MSSFWVFVGAACFLGCSSESSRASADFQRARLLAAEPALGPELGTVPPLPVQYDTGHSPDVASNGSGYLAAFDDGGRIRAVRVDGAGKVLDLSWLDLGEADVSQTAPSVAFGGGHYLVVWSQATEAGALTVQGRLVAPDGKLIGNASFPVSGGEGLDAVVAWNGSNFVVVWLALEGGGVNNIKVALIAPAGTKVPGSERAVSSNGKASEPRICAGTNHSLIAWEDYGGAVRVARATRIATDGSVRDPGGIRLSNGSDPELELALASSGTSFLAAWRRETTPNAIFGSIVNDAGTLAATNFAISHSTLDAGVPSVAFAGDGYAVAWADGREENSVYGTRVSLTGTVASASDKKLASGSPRSTRGSDRTALAWNGERYLLAFLGKGIEGSLLDASLSVVPPAIGLSALPNNQGTPFVAYNGRDYVLSWIDEPDREFEHMFGRGVRISTAGQVLDPNGITFDDATHQGFSLGVASAGAGPSVVAWSTLNGDAWLRTVSQQGVLGSFVQLDSGQSTAPGLASNGQGYLVATTQQTGASAYSVSGRLVDASGVLGAKFPIQTTAAQPGAGVVNVGSGYLVSYLGSGNASFLAPVSSSGSVGTSIPLAASQVFVTSASDGTNALIVWSDPVSKQVQAQRYSASGLQGSPLTLSTTSAGYPAAVGFDGEQYWVVWETEGSRGLDGRAVSSSGTLGPARTLVDDEALSPSLAGDGAGHFILSYFRFGERSRTRRIVSRLMHVDGTLPPGDGGNGGSAGSTGSGGSAGGADNDAGAGGTGEPATGGQTQGGSGNTGAGGRNLGGSSAGGSGGSDSAGGSGGAGRTGGSSNAGGNVSAGSTGRGGATGSGSGGANSASGSSGASGAAGAESDDDGEPGCSLSGGASRSNASFGLLLAALALSLTRRRSRLR